MESFDLIIIGGGRAANLAIKASKDGKKVALIEMDRLGGACPNNGCVPSKLLIGYAHAARAVKNASNHFIDASINSIDKDKIFDIVNEYVQNVDERYESRLNDNITLFRNMGYFVGDKIVRVGDIEITASHIVIATGTRALDVPYKNAWTSYDLFPLKAKIPNSITIVGSGFIACELANFFDAIGVKTTMIVRSDKLLSNEDGEISAIFKTEFTKNVNVKFNTSISNASYSDSHFHITIKNKEGEELVYKDEALLYAIGRKSNADRLHLENTSIKLDERGFIKRNTKFETNVKGVYVIGDAGGEYMLQHAASHEANHLYKIIYENAEPLNFKYMPHAVFSDPEIASVGYTEEYLKKNNINYIKETSNWLASAKAMSLRLSYPRIKILVSPRDYSILGCHIIGPESATMIHQVLAVMHIKNDVRYLKEMVYIHPALNEALLPSVVDIVKKIENQNSLL